MLILFKEVIVTTTLLTYTTMTAVIIRIYTYNMYILRRSRVSVTIETVLLYYNFIIYKALATV